MAEYIEREKVYEMLNALGGCGAKPESWADGWDKAINTAIDELNKIPTADVRPERHGRWIEDGIIVCSECGEEHAWQDYRATYCEDCGAKMDGKGKSEKWIATTEQLPPENQVVDTKIDDEKGVRNETPLIFCNNLWWFPDKSMYAYYTPTHWRYTAMMDGKDGTSQ